MLDHWQLVEGSPFEADTKCSAIIAEIRKRKGLKPDIPPLCEFIDKFWKILSCL